MATAWGSQRQNQCASTSPQVARADESPAPGDLELESVPRKKFFEPCPLTWGSQRAWTSFQPPGAGALLCLGIGLSHLLSSAPHRVRASAHVGAVGEWEVHRSSRAWPQRRPPPLLSSLPPWTCCVGLYSAPKQQLTSVIWKLLLYKLSRVFCRERWLTPNPIQDKHISTII